MIKLLLLIVALFVWTGSFAQTNANVKLENKDGKYHLKVEKEIDGVKTTIDKTYNSLEEMKNDPELDGINLHIFDKDIDEMTFFGEEGEEGFHEMKVMVNIDGDTDIQEDGNRSFVFKSDAVGVVDLHNFDVWIDKDGEKHITVNGEEIEVGDTTSWTDKDGNEYIIEKSNGKIMIMSGEGTSEFNSSDGESFSFNFSSDDNEDGEHKVMMFKSAEANDGEKSTITVEVIKNIIIHLEDVEENEFSMLPGINAKTLKMDELNYYPNPTDGKFTLQFKADKRPTEVKITGLDGRTVYSESLQGFEGTYQNEIDLSAHKKGIYLLQIIQGKKASNKKIVIE